MKPKQKIIKLPTPLSFIQRRIYLVRGREVMLDSDLADIYQVPTKRLNESVRRNPDSFPQDFMFQLTVKEVNFLRFQFGTSRNTIGVRSQFATASKRNIRYLPYAFTEHGVAMLSSVLHSKRATQMNILIIRAFIQLRRILANQETFGKRLSKVEGVQKFHGQVLAGVVEDIKKIKNPPKTNAIGFNWRN